ncbi:hypothetical protein LCGC14_1248400 [marine sediment metagenome]|uniref:Uncharacterized protein n=1 Tax=marine sediment metagenome TaxID=412755 RepID=A0A0F9LQT4_9ZZZZ
MNMVLQLQTTPAVLLAGLTEFRKEVIKVGHYVHPGTKQEFDVDVELLNHWASTFSRYVVAGNQVPIPLGHGSAGLPDRNAGWVTGLVVEGDSLFAIMNLLDPELALTTDVSICVEKEVTDSKGGVFKNIITHIALCINPVITGLDKFIKLSLSIGETNMDILKKLAEKLGLSEDTEEAVMLALDALEKPDKDKVGTSPIVAWVVEKLGLSKDVEPTEEAVKSALDNLKKPKVEVDSVNPLVQLIVDNRALRLSNLVKAGLITPATVTLITTKYMEPAALALSLSTKVDDGFDALHDVLLLNRPVKLDEVTGPQVELSKDGTPVPNVMEVVVNKARKAAGMDD